MATVSETYRPETVRVPIVRMDGEGQRASEDVLAIEEPLEIRISYGPARDREQKTIAVTMRTPGDDAELALGFLLGEGIIAADAEVLAITEPAPNQLRVDLHPEVAFDHARLERHFFVSSACGVCGKTALGSIEVRPPAKRDIAFSRALLHQVPELLRRSQSIFHQTGGLHAAALVERWGELVLVREDVGRHNAVDKVIGAARRRALDVTDKLLVVSGRASYELVQKAIAAAIPAIAAIGAPSSFAVSLAEQYDVTLIGFLRSERLNVYASPWRIEPHA